MLIFRPVFKLSFVLFFCWLGGFSSCCCLPFVGLCPVLFCLSQISFLPTLQYQDSSRTELIILALYQCASYLGFHLHNSPESEATSHDPGSIAVLLFAIVLCGDLMLDTDLLPCSWWPHVLDLFIVMGFLLSLAWS